MKHIIESIIGRKGSHSSLPKIQQWDIVRTRDGRYRMCITDRDLLRTIPYYGDIDDNGILLLYRDKDSYSYSIIKVSDYDKDLKFTGTFIGTSRRNDQWDIIKLYRPSRELIDKFKPKFKHELINLTLDIPLSNIAKKSELIYSE